MSSLSSSVLTPLCLTHASYRVHVHFFACPFDPCRVRRFPIVIRITWARRLSYNTFSPFSRMRWMRLALKSHPSTREKKVNPELQQNTIGLLDIRIQKSHVAGTEKRGENQRERDRGTHARPRIKRISVVQGMYGRWVKKRYMEREFGAVPGSG